MPIWTIPYPRNPFFTGREELLTQLSAVLKIGPATALTQPQAISGLGGIGKTQIALEYSYRSRADYEAVFWVHADTRENVVSDFVAIAAVLDFFEKDAPDQLMAVNAVKQWLNTHGQWLLILDNADDLLMVREFLPLAHGGHVLLTTRAQSMGRLARRIEVEHLEMDVGALFLLRRASLLALDAPLDQASPEDCEAALEFTREVDGLPLALDQAGAYIEETPCSVQDYLRLYHQQQRTLLARRGGLVADHPASVATTWSLSFERVEQMNPVAADLLRVCAFLHSDAIPEALLSEGASRLGPRLTQIASDELAFNEAISVLYGYSLVRRDLSNKALSMHRLVQAVLTDTMSKKTQQMWAKRIVRAVNMVFPKVEFATWESCQKYLPHVIACSLLIERYRFSFSEAADLLIEGGMYLRKIAQYAQAESMLQRALTIMEKNFGPDDLICAIILNELALLYQDQGRFSQAEPLYQRILNMAEQSLEPNDLEIATVLDNQAELYVDQGKYALAEALFHRVLAIHEQRHELDSVTAAITFHNMASLYQNQGNYTQAEAFYERALAIKEKLLEIDDPSAASTLDSLALLYYYQGKYAQAEPLYQRALSIREGTLGSNHPDTAITLNNLALLYSTQEDRHPEAEALYQRALVIYKDSFGDEHPEIATTLHNLAQLYWVQDKYEQAEPLYQRALNIAERLLGHDHPDIVQTVNDLALLYYSQGRFIQAELLYMRALTIAEKSLGFEHPEMAHTLYNLAELYYDQDKHDQAELFYQRALTISEKALPPDHPDISTVLVSLAHLYQEEGRYGEAEPLYQRALAIDEQALGPDHPSTAVTLHNLAFLHKVQGRYGEAEPLFQRALEIEEQALGPDHPSTAITLETYASLLRTMHRPGEALPLEHRARAIRAKQQPS